MKSHLRTVLAAALVGVLHTVAAAHAAELVTNGGFEADGGETWDPTGWQAFADGLVGSIVATDANVSPISGYATAGADQGAHYALIDAALPSASALVQRFVAPTLTQATLSFSLFGNDQGDGVPYVDTTGLDASTGGADRPNQHMRVDILSAGASAFDTGAGVLRSFYVGGPNGRGYGDSPNAWNHFSFDVTDLLAAGGTFQLRFANVANQAAFQTGVDAVSLSVTAVPEPGTWALTFAGLGLLGLAARRRG
jgi:hypothetical protein